MYKKAPRERPYAVNLFLPFLLLFRSTLLPVLVFILFLKPCSFFLCLFFGWYVIFNGHTPSFLVSAFRAYSPELYIDYSPIKYTCQENEIVDNVKFGVIFCGYVADNY